MIPILIPTSDGPLPTPVAVIVLFLYLVAIVVLLVVGFQLWRDEMKWRRERRGRR